MEIKFNIPFLQEQQIWKRNEYIKNWGNYVPLLFRQGKPTYLIPNYSFLVTQSLYHLLLTAILVYDYYSQLSGNSILIMARLIFLLLNLALLRHIVQLDPGISSRGDPIINEAELSGYKNFCNECKCMQSESIQHCVSCNVCIQGRYAHINITKMCITQKNLRHFVLFCFSTIIQAILII